MQTGWKKLGETTRGAGGATDGDLVTREHNLVYSEEKINIIINIITHSVSAGQVQKTYR